MLFRTAASIMIATNKLIFLLQNLEFVINMRKSILQPVKQTEILRLQINTEEMTLSLSEENLNNIIQRSQVVSSQP